ncbi:hypothetical protein [Mycobacterium sp. RTGN5]|uniref:hypothetical protein n=1 Tax=Mycobacterium sp. RTGN5 TaxID=3016522 RepID=UPI0029C7BF44|nr:hypothetical protein [Mycobacterium sp. RTGN5]
MKNTDYAKRIMAAALLSSAVGAAGLALGPGTAHATSGPFNWCPGQSMEWPSGPNQSFVYAWDMNTCHTWYRVGYGYGNVPRLVEGASTLSGSGIWNGDNPPGDNPSGFNCGLMWCPAPPHEDPNFNGG